MKLWKYLEGGGKNAVAVWHRRYGKDELALRYTSIAMIKRPGTYWHMLPEATQARKAIWEAINPHTGKRRIDEAFPKELRKSTRENEMFLKFGESTWQVVGSDNFNSLVGSPPVGIVYSEWPLANPSAAAYLRPILAENDGSELFIYTPRGRNHGLTTYERAKKDPKAFAQRLTVEDTGAITKERLAEELAWYISEYGREDGEAFYRQEYYCDFNAPLIGAILGRYIERAERESRVSDEVQFDPDGAPIEISSDIGFRDTASWWFWQPKPGGYSIIDYDADRGLDADDWIDRLHAKGYPIGHIWLPKDAKAKTFQSKRSAMERFLKAFGSNIVRVVPADSVPNRINAARRIIGQCEFAHSACEEGLEGLRSWCYEWDDDLKMYGKEPLHNWACFVAGTLVDTPHGLRAIESLRAGDEVTVPSGIKKVTGRYEYRATKLVEITLADGRQVICTPEHKFFTDAGLIPCDTLTYDRTLYTGRELLWRLISLISRVAGFTGINQAISVLFQPKNSSEMESKVRLIIGNCGAVFMESFLMIMRFIMLTMTSQIMKSQISYAFQGAYINLFMGLKMGGGLQNGIQRRRGLISIQKLLKNSGEPTDRKGLSILWPCWFRQERPRKNGMPAKPVFNGTEKTEKLLGQNVSRSKKIALFAIRSLLRFGRINRNSAGKIVALKTFDADTSVFDLTVEHDHCFIAGGILTSNSHPGDAFSYGAQVMELAESKKPKEEERPAGITLNDLWKDHERGLTRVQRI